MPKFGNKPQHETWIQAHLDYPHKDWCLMWPFPTQPGEYPSFIKGGKKIYVHRFICRIVYGDPPTEDYQSAHSCHRGREGCVNLHHVRWKTQSDNLKESGPRRTIKLFPDQADEIRGLKGSEPAHVTAIRFGVTACTIKDIQTGRTWKPGTRGKTMFLDEDIHRIRALKGVVPARELAQEYGVRPNMIYKIQLRLNWKHVPELNPSVSIG